MGAIAGVVCILIAVVSVLGGVRVLIFASGPMGPGIPARSIAITLPTTGPDIRTGLIISATRSDGARVTHRAVRGERAGDRYLVTMRGDANNVNDAAPYDVTRGADRVIAAVPGIGKALVALREPWVLAILAALAVLALLPDRRSHPPVG